MEKTTINQRIVYYRKRAHLTQVEVAEKIGMKGSTYSQMERKGKIPTDRLVALAEVFGIASEKLLYDEEEYQKLYADNLQENSLTLSQDSFYKKPDFIDDFTPTNSEISILKVYRLLSNKEKAEVKEFILGKWKKG